MAASLLYEGSATASGAIITAVAGVSAANLIIIPSANGLQVGIYGGA